MIDRVWVVFGLLIVQTILVGAIYLCVHPQVGAAQPHGGHQDMLVANSGTERGGATIVLGGLLGGVQVLTFGALLYLGECRSNRDRSSRGRFAAVAIGSLVLLSVFLAMMLAYGQELGESAPAFWGPFPPATTIMIAGLWLAPWIFVMLYVIRFDRMVVSDEDLARFRTAIGAQDKSNSL